MLNRCPGIACATPNHCFDSGGLQHIAMEPIPSALGCRAQMSHLMRAARFIPLTSLLMGCA
jgi:hypothetical protein